jgi:DNA polymerase
MEELKAQVAACRACPLALTRTNTVFGAGNPQSRVMFVGEGPGQNEDLQGEPFVGRAGVLLDLLLDAVGLSRKHNIYIANIVKCRPPGNRNPKPEEMDACIGYLRGQTRLIAPRFIVCLGRIAAQKIIAPDFKVTQSHGQWTERNGILLMGTFHPAALLRNPRQKPLAFDDFTRLRDSILADCPEVYGDRPPL